MKVSLKSHAHNSSHFLSDRSRRLVQNAQKLTLTSGGGGGGGREEGVIVT